MSNNGNMIKWMRLFTKLIIGVAISNFIIFFMFNLGYIGWDLVIYTIFTSIIALFVVPAMEYVRVVSATGKISTRLGKLIYTFGIGLSLGFLIWTFIISILLLQSWSPLRGISNSLKDILYPMIMIPSYLLAGYIGYKIGEKRGFKPTRL